VMAMTQGLALGRHVSWNVSAAAAKVVLWDRGSWEIQVLFQLNG
jgi:hypothetical protein